MLEPDFELLYKLAMPFGVGPTKIIKELFSSRHHSQKASARMVVLGVLLQMVGELLDFIRKDGNLHFGRTSIFLMSPEFLYHLSLGFGVQHAQ